MPWRKLSIRTQIYFLLGSIITVTIIGAFIMAWYTYNIQSLFNRTIKKQVSSFETASLLVYDLVSQKGFVSYYLIDKNPDWLIQLKRSRRSFQSQIAKAREIAESPEEKDIISKIEKLYINYISTMDMVTKYYKEGEMEKGYKIHKEQRKVFFDILDLCSKFRDFQKQEIKSAQIDAVNKARRLRMLAYCAIFGVILIGGTLLILLTKKIMNPLKLLIKETSDQDALLPKDEISALRKGVYGLKEKYNVVSKELEKSHNHLIQAEKMALVGKLAAGTAHSIRNPLTSVKMRLFSLSRSLDLDEDQKEDFDVISEEINHIDNILRNFLEFARPPSLRIQYMSPSEVMDQALLLMKHRFKATDTQIVISRQENLPEIYLDPEQLKEAFVNIMVNACEAMGMGGRLEIIENLEQDTNKNKFCVIKIKDSGPGIPENIKKRVFEPFFTTKDSGSGLGLSIVARIIEQHKGEIYVESYEKRGSTFIIRLPV